MAGKRTNRQIRLDEDAFVRDFVEGKLAPAELAARHGRSLAQINDILAGRNYVRVLPRIQAAMASRQQRTLRQLASLQDDAVTALEKAVRGQADTVSLSAAREILSRSLDTAHSGAPKAARGSTARAASLQPPKLAPEAKRRVLAELDGPAPEP